ncbi:MAG TPA: CehA/McbA family metallohydrolase [Desulfobacterales bacterium]
MSKSDFKLFALLFSALFLTASGAMAESSINNWNIYYGHLHNHTTVSDGSGSPDQAYNYAKNVAGLDFFSTADHAESTSSTEYNTIKNTANAYNEDDVFTAFWGFEWSSERHGHVTVTYANDYCTAFQLSTNTFSELLTWLASREAVAFFNHPGRESQAFQHYDGTISDKFVGMELWNKTDDFDTYYYNDGFHSNDGGMGHFDEALLRGWKIGASGSDDNHGTDWGTRTDYRMAILAFNLTREDLYAAMKARRFYSTLDKNLGLYFEMDGHVMGSEIAGGSNSVYIEVNDADNEIVEMVELLKNGAVINTWYPNHSTAKISDTVSTVEGDYLYCRVRQWDSDEAISSPIFITSGIPVVTAPVVSNSAATNITTNAATLNGTVIDDGGETPEVIIYWGDNDGGTNEANWDYSDSLGFLSGNFSMDVINLLENTTYYYRSYAINSTGDDWADSSEFFTTTNSQDTTPPTPNPMTFASAPRANGESSISMTATSATDPSGVEYYFECVSTGCHDSGWQSSTSYTDSGLSAGTTYTYRVKARDNSVNLNETAYSDNASAATDEPQTKGFCGISPANRQNAESQFSTFSLIPILLPLAPMFISLVFWGAIRRMKG